MELNIIGLEGIPLLKKGDDLASMIIESSRKQGYPVSNGDIFIIAETALAKANGEIINLEALDPNEKALEIASKTGKNPKLVQAILNESQEIIKIGPDFIISETKHGFVCANAGIDESNVEIGLATPIPSKPDDGAEEIRKKIESTTHKKVAIIISDTQGRAFREGAVGVSIGVSGIKSLWDRRGEKDLYGRELETTAIGVADELASAASIVMGQAKEGIPVVMIRGVSYFEKLRSTTARAKDLIRPKKFDVFR